MDRRAVADAALAGLFGVILPTFVYTFFGTCGQLSVGPEAGLSLL